MSMAGDPSGADADDAKLSWREREMVAALKRLANAQLQVSQLEEQRSEATSPTTLDPADVADLDSIDAEVAKLQKKSQSRFGGSAARERLSELEARKRVVLDRMGFASEDEYLEARSSAASVDSTPSPSVDPVVESFARRELEAAESAYRDLLMLPDEPDAEAVGEPDEGDDPDESGGPGGGEAALDGEAGNGSGASPTIDLTD